MTTRYTCAFLFDESDRLALVKKEYGPEAVIGYWNGIGGKIEEGETAFDANLREIREETGLDITRCSATHFCTHEFVHEKVAVLFFTVRGGWAFHTNLPKKNDVGEALDHFHLATVHACIEVVPNLHWLIPLALDDTTPCARVIV